LGNFVTASGGEEFAKEGSYLIMESVRHCERSEAIHSLKAKLDCFVASAPRNDEAKPLKIYGYNCG